MTFRTPLILTSCALALTACGDRDADTDATLEELQTRTETAGEQLDQAEDRLRRAVQMESESYDVENASGYSIGDVTIRDTASGVDVVLNVTAIPEGAHAIHFHETGTCDGPDFTSAGGHYNPDGRNHGMNAASPNPHAGDMRNFDAPASGVVRTTVTNEMVSLSDREGFAPLRDGNGTALIIHAGPDDYESQPSGDAGARIACAVIR